jgi:hypothetical protein
MEKQTEVQNNRLTMDGTPPSILMIQVAILMGKQMEQQVDDGWDTPQHIDDTPFAGWGPNPNDLDHPLILDQS